MTDILQTWHRARDPLRARHGLNNAQYGVALTIYARNKRRLSAGAKNVIAALIVGAAGGAWVVTEVLR